MNEDPVTSQPLVNNLGSHGNEGEISKLPDGLQQLSCTKEVTISQHIDPAEVLLWCCARPCRYSVYAKGCQHQFLYIQEVSDCYARQIMGAARGFSLKFSDNDQVDVIRVVRPQTCSRGCCGVCCTLPWLQVQSPPGTTVATIKERRTCMYPVYDIVDKDDKMLYYLTTKCCYSDILSCVSDININIYDANDQLAAQLHKQTKCNGAEYVGSTNNFTIKYLAEQTVLQKIIILGSMFLIDYHYFERQNRFCC